MPRPKRRSRQEDEEEVDDVKDVSDVEEQASPPKSRRTRKVVADSDDEEEGGDPVIMFSQQAPEASQGLAAVRVADQRNLESMDLATREKALSSLSRLVLFRALERESIDRPKICKDAGLDGTNISTAAFQEVAKRLRNVFGFELNRIPKYMKIKDCPNKGDNPKGLPTKFKDRHYVLNGVLKNTDGMHSKAIHSMHQDSSIEKGLLILILALIFCKGESRPGGSRWILARDLYRLLHDVDEAIPEEPPAQGTARAKAGTQASQKNRYRDKDNLTPNVDGLLDQFVQSDYLFKEKATEENVTSQTVEEGDVLYSMGPRSAMEVGRKQVIYFCAEILDEEPDPSMLKEAEGEQEDDDVYMEGTQTQMSQA
jgi:hypothetical protein